MVLSLLGGDVGLRPRVDKIGLEVGDRLLLCTDGLTHHVSDEALAVALASDVSARQTCRRLVAEANAAGGSDNVTVVVGRFTAGPSYA